MVDQLNAESDGRRKLGNLGRTKYYELLASGELKSVKIGRRRMVTDSALQEFIARLQGAA